MKMYQVSVSALIQAPADQVYAILADYHHGHPHILPKPYFLNLEVEEGGVGAGTTIRFQMRAFGKTQTARAAITEPEPGRVLVETLLTDDIVTTFTVVPHADGRQAETTILTQLKAPQGWLAPLERFITTRFLQRVYRQELQLLDAFAQAQNQSAAASL